MNSFFDKPKTATTQPDFPDNSPPNALEPEATVPVRILYVDDEPSLRRFGELVLLRSGFAVDTAADGEEAWDALKARAYDLLITDNHMPNLTGLELIQKVGTAGLRLPIILASSIVSTLTKHDLPLFECGVLLAKPFTPIQLVSVVRDLLREKMPA